LLLDMGSRVLARTNDGRTPLHCAESKGHEAIVNFLRKIANNKRRPKSTTAPIVDPAAQAAAEVAAAAMAALLIACGGGGSKASAAFQARKLQQGTKA
jgi:ankyrin repeat protein